MELKGSDGDKAEDDGGEAIVRKHPLVQKLDHMPDMGPLISREAFEAQRQSADTKIDERLGCMPKTALRRVGEGLSSHLTSRVYKTLQEELAILQAIQIVEKSCVSRANAMAARHAAMASLAIEAKRMHQMERKLDAACVDLQRALVGIEGLRMMLPSAQRPPAFSLPPILHSPVRPRALRGDDSPVVAPATGDKGLGPDVASPPRRQSSRRVLVKEGGLRKRVSGFPDRFRYRYFRCFQELVPATAGNDTLQKVVLEYFHNKNSERPRGRFVVRPGSVRIIPVPPELVVSPRPRGSSDRPKARYYSFDKEAEGLVGEEKGAKEDKLLVIDCSPTVYQLKGVATDESPDNSAESWGKVLLDAVENTAQKPSKPPDAKPSEASAAATEGQGDEAGGANA